MLNLTKEINKFIEYAEMDEDIILYNEAGLQHELGYYFRNNFESNGNDYKLRFERNVKDILGDKNDKMVKSEIDLYIFNEQEKYSIELKLPNKGAYPRRMYQAFEDVAFLEQLHSKDFNECAFLFVTPLKGFQEGRSMDGIYRHFRADKIIRQLPIEDVPKFIKDKDKFEELNISGEYCIEWKDFKQNHKYFLITIN